MPRVLVDWKKIIQYVTNTDLAEDLVRHCWIHDGYPNNGYLQMTTEQKKLYCRIIGAKFNLLEPKFKED